MHMKKKLKIKKGKKLSFLSLKNKKLRDSPFFFPFVYDPKEAVLLAQGNGQGQYLTKTHATRVATNNTKEQCEGAT